MSVVIPTRDRADLLALCLDRLSAGAQTLDSSRYEVIVTDDGVTDAARELIVERYPWAHRVQGPRRGPSANRNNGVRAARGEWVVFTDDDTLPDRDWLEQLLNAASEVEVVEGCTICRAGIHSPREHSPENDRGGCWWTCNLAIRRDTFDRLGGFDELFVVPHLEDVDLRVRAFAAGVKWRFAPLAIVDHPPRRERFGAARGPWHAAHVVYARIHAEPFTLVTCMRSVVRERSRAILRHPFGIDSVAAAASAAIELAVIVRDWRSWQRPARLLEPHGR